jgi:hypothetical protein
VVDDPEIALQLGHVGARFGPELFLAVAEDGVGVADLLAPGREREDVLGPVAELGRAGRVRVELRAVALLGDVERLEVALGTRPTGQQTSTETRAMTGSAIEGFSAAGMCDMNYS